MTKSSFTLVLVAACLAHLLKHYNKLKLSLSTVAFLQKWEKMTAVAAAPSHTHYPSRELQDWRRKRVSKNVYVTFFNIDESELLPKADRVGPILDFAIAGFPKCGTTAMMKVLTTVSTMPIKDVCTPVKNTIYYSYINWANEFGNGAHNFTEGKPLKGSKCPRWLEGPDLDDFGEKLPKTNLIVGIRHPVLFFQSFTNQLYHGNGSDIDEFVNKKRLENKMSDNHKCKHAQLVCVARSPFHLSLARLGKTLLGPEERDLLSAELYQSQRRFNNTSAKLNKFPTPMNNTNTSIFGIPNNIFLFDSSQGKEDTFMKNLPILFK